MKNKQMLAIATILLLGLGVFATTNVSAHGFGGGDGTLVSRLAETFGKSEDEVQAVFDSAREEKQAEAQANFETKLQEAVDNGDLTADQQALILNKHSELMAEHQADRESAAGMTREEHRAEMETHRAEIQAWADDNGIDLSWFGPREGQGFGGPKRMGR